MYQTTSTENLVTIWSNAQRELWDSWFDLLGGAVLARGVQSASLWQSGLRLLRESAQTTFEAQQASNRILTAALTVNFDLADGSNPATMREEVQNLSQSLAQDTEAKVLQVGMSASLSKHIGEEDIIAFAYISGDVNPVHIHDSYAQQTRFGGRIAHGMLAAGLVSAVLGTKLPGPGTIYLSQSLQFRAPVAIGDEVTATATVIKAKEGKPIYTLKTECRNQNDEIVLEGEAVILYEPVQQRAALPASQA